MPGELVDDSVERRPGAARGGRRGHGLLAQGQPAVCHLWPIHDLVREAIQRSKK